MKKSILLLGCQLLFAVLVQGASNSPTFVKRGTSKADDELVLSDEV